ncbi:hypothetical protein [Halobacillus yeomjeoni]|uniref:Lipoprotein n=1 Tax=Halobacillus yeomjeoni TaxID=311194 RepID=A0A931HUP1_9BACI|nr:hypothetical protein [Halobacillus yeomjeoni]MBH0229746.1 hypothetical protein [Halobacillus yeomjeoni]
MKEILFTMVLGLTILLTGCNTNEAEESVESYYTSLMNEDYDSAFSHLLIFDEHYDEGTDLSPEEAEKKYIAKVDYLKGKGYKIKDFEILSVHKEEAVPPSVKSELIYEVDGNEQKVEELIQVTDEGLFVDLSEEDPYAKYRDGQMEVNLPQNE